MGRAASLSRATSVRTITSALAVTVALTTAVYSAPALASEVTGKLLLATYRPAIKEPAPGAFQWEIENGMKEIASERLDAKRELAVILVGEGESAMPERPEIAFSGGGLLPSTIVARPGTTLLFVNEDEIAHEMYAVGKGGIAPEATSPRGRRSVVLKEPGVIELRDQLLPHLHGHIHVIPDVIAVATPDGSGQFSFPEIKPGTYTLKVLLGAAELASQEVEVGPKALAVDPIALTAPSAK